MKTLNQTCSEFQMQDYNIIPLSSLGTPFKSTSTTDWYNHYINGGTVGMPIGMINGGLECITIHTYNEEYNTIMEELVDQLPPNIFDYLGIKEHEGDYHLFYLCPEVEFEGNEILAHHEDASVMIEKLGEKDFIPFHIQNDIPIQFRAGFIQP
jgi:hypothetical protein